jgi:MurNAc alpha-1-phosphate uridylyltransferase
MRAMILAAGRGERLRPLTDTIPKPLIEVNGQALIFHHLDALAAAGFKNIVINLGHLGEQIKERVGDGSRWSVNIHYSQEPEGALETGGGIFQALPLLGNSPFLVVNGDIFTNYDFRRLRSLKCDYAHLVLIPVPEWADHGDFALERGKVHNEGREQYTFSGISLYHPRFFKAQDSGRWSVVPLLRDTIENHLVTGELFSGTWNDAGTQERLENINSS